MISAATVMPMPETGPSVTRDWIKANVIVAAIYALMGTLTFTSDALLGLDKPTAGMLLRATGAAIAFLGVIVPTVAYAMLTGTVLGNKLPSFPMRGWILLHGSLGAVIGLISAALTLFGTRSGSTATAMPPQMALFVGGAIAAFIFGPMLGAMMGGLQALVLRRAATGMLAWILWSAVASTVLLAAMVLTAVGIGLDNLAKVNFVAIEAAVFAGMIASAVVMLPALKRLTPRG